MENLKSFVRTGLSAITVLAAAATVYAFPPAPHHLIKGTVRDEMGYPIEVDGTVTLKTVTGVVVEAPLTPSLLVDSSYRMEVPMDAGVTADSYKPTALNPLVPFTMQVKIGSLTYYPFEMSGDFASLGEAGGTTVIDLTFGVDSDGDGIPDAWEQSLISRTDRYNSLSDVNPGDDLDGDGLSNFEEYLAHTYAYDVLDGLSLKIKAVSGDAYIVEFLVIDGHSYSLTSSTDLSSWSSASFRTSSDGELISSYLSEEVELLEVEIPREGSEAVFFKLQIQ